jgi:hypothetical protein
VLQNKWVQLRKNKLFSTEANFIDVTVTLSRQQVSDMFYLGELEEETINNRCLINDKKEELIKDVVSSIPVYDHIMHEDCKKKGPHKIFHLF